MKEGYIFHTL